MYVSLGDNEVADPVTMGEAADPRQIRSPRPVASWCSAADTELLAGGEPVSAQAVTSAVSSARRFQRLTMPRLQRVGGAGGGTSRLANGVHRERAPDGRPAV
jgi:hypothetical protein